MEKLYQIAANKKIWKRGISDNRQQRWDFNCTKIWEGSPENKAERNVSKIHKQKNFI